MAALKSFPCAVLPLGVGSGGIDCSANKDVIVIVGQEEAVEGVGLVPTGVINGALQHHSTDMPRAESASLPLKQRLEAISLAAGDATEQQWIKRGAVQETSTADLEHLLLTESTARREMRKKTKHAVLRYQEKRT